LTPDQASAAYHHNMNQDNYQKWMKETFVLPLLSKSGVVIHNAQHHNVKINKILRSSSINKKVQKWLQKHNIPFADYTLKPTLDRPIKQYALP
jgi:hypothetical protein